MKQFTKLLSVLLALVLISGLMPAAALAAGDTLPKTEGSQSGSSGTNTGTDAGTNAGTNTGTEVRKDSGTEGGSVSGDDSALTASPTAISEISFQAADRVYDGTAANASVSVSFPGLTPAPAAEDYQISAVYTSPNVTADETPNLNISFSLTEAGKAKYTLSDSLTLPTAIFGRITPAPLTVKAKDQVLPEGVEDIAQGPEQVIVNPAAGETAAVTAVTLTVEDGKIIPSEAQITVTNGSGLSTLDNYTLGYESGSLTLQTAEILQAPAAPGTLEQPFLYTGLSQPLLTAGTARNGTMEYSLKSSPLTLSGEDWSPWSPVIPQAIAAGTYRLRYRAAGAPGYRSTQPQELTVTLAPQVIALNATAEKVYDGTTDLPRKNGYDDLFIDTQPLEGKQIFITGITGSRFPTKNVGSDLSVTPGSITLAGEDAANYEIRLTVTGKITPRSVTLTLGAEKKYGTPDPPVSWRITGGSLAKGDTLNLTVTRDPGEQAGGQYAFHAVPGSNPNYDIHVTDGVLTIHKAKPAVLLELGSKSRHPSQTVTVTVTARNGESALIASGWNQPQQPKLLVNGESLALTRKNPSAQDPEADSAVWTAQYKVPKGAKGKLTFQASMDDSSGNYLEGEASAQLEIRRSGSNPDTGDQSHVGLFSGLALGSAAGLGIVIWLLIKNKNRKGS